LKVKAVKNRIKLDVAVEIMIMKIINIGKSTGKNLKMVNQIVSGYYTTLIKKLLKTATSKMPVLNVVYMRNMVENGNN